MVHVMAVNTDCRRLWSGFLISELQTIIFRGGMTFPLEFTLKIVGQWVSPRVVWELRGFPQQGHCIIPDSHTFEISIIKIKTKEYNFWRKPWPQFRPVLSSLWGVGTSLNSSPSVSSPLQGRVALRWVWETWTSPHSATSRLWPQSSAGTGRLCLQDRTVTTISEHPQFCPHTGTVPEGQTEMREEQEWGRGLPGRVTPAHHASLSLPGGLSPSSHLRR